MSTSGPPAWLLAVPLGSGGHGGDFETLYNHCKTFIVDEPREIHLPAFRVGTLDGLMTLSDELHKIEPMILAAVLKMKSQYGTLVQDNVKSHEERGETPPSAAPLLISTGGFESAGQGRPGAGKTAMDYLQEFRWQPGRYPEQRPLADIVERLRAKAFKADEAVRQMSTQYNDIKNELVALKRRGTNNLMSGEMADVLSDSEQAAFRAQIALSPSNDFLKPIVVVVQREQCASFEAEYESLEADTIQVFEEAIDVAVSRTPDVFGTKWRWDTFAGQKAISVAGGIAGQSSPVVPRSLTTIATDSDGNTLYIFWALCGYGSDAILDGLNSALRTKGIMVKDISALDAADEAGDAAAAEVAATRVPLKKQIAKMQARHDLTRQKVMHQLKPQYAVVYEVWMHLKVVQVFVESVLQYGLPDLGAQQASTDERGRTNLASHYIVGFFRPKDAKTAAACVKHLSKV